LDVDWLVKKKSKAGLKYRLILVCKVESPDDTYDYAGSTKETLYMPKIKKDVSQLINKRFSEYLVNNPECAAQISSFF